MSTKHFYRHKCLKLIVSFSFWKLNADWCWLMLIDVWIAASQCIVELSGEVNHLLEEFTIELTIMPGARSFDSPTYLIFVTNLTNQIGGEKICHMIKPNGYALLCQQSLPPIARLHYHNYCNWVSIIIIDMFNWDLIERMFHPPGAATVQAALEFMTPGRKIQSANFVSETIKFSHKINIIIQYHL